MPQPAEEEQQVPALDEQEHGEDEERLVGVVAALLVVAGHVADPVREDQEADPRDDEHHEDAQRVDQDVEPDAEVAARGEPRPERRRPRSAPPACSPSMSRNTTRVADERAERRARGDEPRLAPGDPRAGEGDREHGRGRQEQRDPGGLGHPRRVVSLSRSRSARRRDMATMKPSPTTASEAATTMTASAKIWPSSVAGLARERDEGEVPGVQHDLEREQDDQRAAPREHAERADREEHDRDDEVGGDAGPEHDASSTSSRWGGSVRRG